MPGWILTALALITFVFWLKYGLDMVLGMRHVPKLAAFPPLEVEQLPSLSIVFAARDEALKIEAATRSLLAVDYPSLEIVAELIDGLQPDSVCPIPNADAMENLKFSECLRRKSPLRCLHHGSRRFPRRTTELMEWCSSWTTAATDWESSPIWVTCSTG